MGKVVPLHRRNVSRTVQWIRRYAWYRRMQRHYDNLVYFGVIDAE